MVDTLPGARPSALDLKIATGWLSGQQVWKLRIRDTLAGPVMTIQNAAQSMSAADIAKAVLQYVKAGKSYNASVMIKGPWGSGKSYFWKNHVEPLLRENKRKPLYVSLYGLERASDMDFRILMARIPKLQNGNLQLLGAIGRGALKKWSGVDANDLKKAKIPLKEHVICFDDLERISPNVTYTDVLGYINRLTEHEYIPVIILAAEDEILNDSRRSKEEKEAYERYREKVIWRSWQYDPPLDVVIRECVEDYDGAYGEFLRGHYDSLLGVALETKMTNLRIIKSALTLFQPVFDRVNSNKGISADKKKDLLSVLLGGFIGLCVKYSQGEQEFKKIHFLFGLEGAALWVYVAQEEREETDDATDKKYAPIRDFANNYLNGDIEVFGLFKSLWYYVSSGLFDNDALSQECNRLLEVIATEEQSIESKLLSDFRGMRDDEFEQALTEVREKVENATFEQLSTWESVAYLFVYFSQQGLIDESVPDVTDWIKEGVNKALGENRLISDEEMIFARPSLGEDWNQLTVFFQDKRRLFRRQSFRTRVQKWFEALQLDFVSALHETLSLDSDIVGKSLLEELDSSALAALVSARTNAELREFGRWLNARYRPGGEAILYRERLALQEIGEALQAKAADGSMGRLRSWRFRELAKDIEEIVGRLDAEASRRAGSEN